MNTDTTDTTDTTDHAIVRARAHAHAMAQRKAEAAERKAEEAKTELAQYHGEPVAVQCNAGEALKAAFKELRRDGYHCSMGESAAMKESEFYLWSGNSQYRDFREPRYYNPVYYLYHGSSTYGDCHSTEYLSKLAHAVAVLKKHGLPVEGPESVHDAIAIKADYETPVFAILPTV